MPSSTRLRKVLAILIFAPMLAACARNELDRYYEESLRVYKLVEAEHYERVARWREERDRRLLESGPAALSPTYPVRVHPSVIVERRMEIMEQRVVQFLATQCGHADVDCHVSALQGLGFECTGTGPIVCLLLNTARGEGDNVIKGSRERHRWTVTIRPEGPGSATTAKAVLAEESR